MGDHGISLSIKAEFHGKTYEIKDASWNWCGPVDMRVIEFFTNMTEDGMARYHAAREGHWRERNNAKIEADEKAELARLKAKYEAKA